MANTKEKVSNLDNTNPEPRPECKCHWCQAHWHMREMERELNRALIDAENENLDHWTINKKYQSIVTELKAARIIVEECRKESVMLKEIAAYDAVVERRKG